MKIIKLLLFRKILEKLYQDYFPEYSNLDGLSRDLNEQEGNIRLAVTYLQDRGLITERENEWRITAQGINLLEQRDLLKPEPGEPDFWQVDIKAKS